VKILRAETGRFLDMKEQPSPQLSDNDWMCDFAFYTGIAQDLNEQNNRLEGKKITDQPNIF
jgi:hypothetical protein